MSDMTRPAAFPRKAIPEARATARRGAEALPAPAPAAAQPRRPVRFTDWAMI